jgi:hypothetical protein
MKRKNPEIVSVTEVLSDMFRDMANPPKPDHLETALKAVENIQ